MAIYNKKTTTKLGRSIDQSDDLKPMHYAQKMGVKSPVFSLKKKK